MSGVALLWRIVVLAMSVASIVYDLLAAAALRHWMKEDPASEFSEPPEPITFFRPLKRGVPNLRDKLDRLVATSRPEDQIILGVDPGSEEETICEQVHRAHPEHAIDIVRGRSPTAMNPKIARLVRMETVARHDAWLLSDSEAIFEENFLTALRREWQSSDCAALTTGYRFAHAQSWPQQCDAIGILLGLWPGIALVRRYGHVDFTLGACTLFDREALQGIGGWAAFADDLGEDQRLGAALVRHSGKIHLSRHIVTLDSDPMTWSEYWRHQRRVSVTYRAANPAGFAGLAITFGPVWCLLALLVWPEPWLLWAFLVVTGIRAWRIGFTARILEFSVPAMPVAAGIAGLMEALCWALSWIFPKVWWSGRWWHVDSQGKILPAEKSN